MSIMIKEPNMSTNTKCRICEKNITDIERIKVTNPTNSFGRITHSFFHIECVRATIGYEQTNEEIEQATALMKLLDCILRYVPIHKHGKEFIKDFVKHNRQVWDNAEVFAKKMESE